jgi:hypothetical protein
MVRSGSAGSGIQLNNNNNNSGSSSNGGSSAVSTSCFTDVTQTQPNTLHSSVANILSADFTFDPASFDADGRGQDTLDLLQDGIGDPAELLSYLGPAVDGASGGACGGSNADDLLSLFT